jgi:outer membrane protein assembly factor BamB
MSHAQRLPAWGVPVAAVVCWLVGIGYWVSYDRGRPLPPRKPGDDGGPPLTAAAGATERPSISPETAEPQLGPGTPATDADLAAAVWPCFRGPARDNVASGGPPLAREWPATGPPVVWTVDVGEGYAGPAVRAGRVYLLDYDADAGQDVLRCLSLADGSEIWRNGYAVEITRNHGMSRTVPAIADGVVVTLGPRLHLVAWNAETGAALWHHDLVAEFSAVEPAWYAGQNPLIDNGRVIIATGGKALFVAFDLNTGTIAWQTPSISGWEMTHASIAVMPLGGRDTFVTCFTGGTAGVDADTGRLLWQTTEGRMRVATCPTPVPLPGNLVLLTSGYNPQEGGVLLAVAEAADGLASTEVVQRLTPQELNVEQQTPIFFDGKLHGIRKRGGGPLVLFDVDPVAQRLTQRSNTGRLRFGLGPHLLTDEGLMFAVNNEGRLTLLEVTADGYRELASTDLFTDGHDAWGPLALVAGRLLVRDMTRLKCVDVSQ